MALHPKTDIYHDIAVEVYRKNIKIIIFVALLTTIVETVFDALGNISAIFTLLRIIVTAPLLICTYNIYIRALKGERMSADYVFTWLTKPDRIVKGVKSELAVMFRLIGWYILYIVTAALSSLFGILAYAIIIGGLILLYYKSLQYNGIFYECAAYPEYEVSVCVDDGLDQMKYNMNEYVSLWCLKCLPLTLLTTFLNIVFKDSSLSIIMSLAGNLLLQLWVLPRFHLEGIMVYDSRYAGNLEEPVDEFNF